MLILVGAALILLFLAASPSGAIAGFVTVDLSGFATRDLQALDMRFPSGSVTLGGVPFLIQPNARGLETWDSGDLGELPPFTPNPVILDIAVNAAGVQRVDTLINTRFGQAGPNSFAYLEFIGTGGFLPEGSDWKCGHT